MVKLTFDNLIFYIQSAGGISSYWYELTKRIIEKNEFNITNIIPSENEPNNIYFKNLKKIWENCHSENFSPKLATILNCKIKSDTKFIFHSSYNRIAVSKNAINVVTIHDLIPELFFKGWRRLFHKYRRLIFLKKADAIVCVSENTKKDLLEIYPFCNKIPIEVIYNGMADDFFKIENSKQSKKVLFVGRRPLYKNFKFAVAVLKTLPQYTLSIVGNSLNKDELSMLEGVEYDLYSNISNAKLNELYNESHCLLYPSSYEGFGIPIVEAMRSGCPVIALNKGAVAEIADKNCATLLNDLNIIQFQNAIKKLESKEFKDRIVINGLENSKKYNWDQSADKLSNFYKFLLK